MVFSSIEFLFRFLPIFLIIYFLAAPHQRNFVLLIGSLIFYSVGEPMYVLLMVFSILINHILANGIYQAQRLQEKTDRDTQGTCKFRLILAMLFNFGMQGMLSSQPFP